MDRRKSLPVSLSLGGEAGSIVRRSNGSGIYVLNGAPYAKTIGRYRIMSTLHVMSDYDEAAVAQAWERSNEKVELDERRAILAEDIAVKSGSYNPRELAPYLPQQGSNPPWWTKVEAQLIKESRPPKLAAEMWDKARSDRKWVLEVYHGQLTTRPRDSSHIPGFSDRRIRLRNGVISKLPD